MRGRPLFALVAVLVAACSGGHVAPLAPPSPGAHGFGAPGRTTATLFRGKITHVFVIVQENRTFDNIFGGVRGGAAPPPYPGADSDFSPSIAPLMQSDAPSQSPPVSNSHNSWQCLAEQNFSDAIWAQIGQGTSSCQQATKQNVGALTYYPVAHRTIYWEIAQKNVLGDAFFAITSTGSYPGHQYIVAEQSAMANADVMGNQLVADQPGADRGCFAQPDESISVPILQPSGFSVNEQLGNGGECYPSRTYADLFAVAGISWKHYSTNEQPSSVFNGFINHLGWYQQTVDTSSTTKFPLSYPQLFTDIANYNPSSLNPTLPQFAWIKPPCVDASDHPRSRGRRAELGRYRHQYDREQPATLGPQRDLRDLGRLGRLLRPRDAAVAARGPAGSRLAHPVSAHLAV